MLLPNLLINDPSKLLRLTKVYYQTPLVVSLPNILLLGVLLHNKKCARGSFVTTSDNKQNVEFVYKLVTIILAVFSLLEPTCDIVELQVFCKLDKEFETKLVA